MSERQRLQVVAEGAAEVVAAEGEFDGGFEEAEFIAGVVARAFEAHSVNGPAAEKVAEAVG